MAILQTKKQSDIERRLKVLRQQVYGKESVSSIKYQVSGDNIGTVNSHNTKYIIQNTDLSYLYKDLAKIGILASLAIGLQIILWQIF